MAKHDVTLLGASPRTGRPSSRLRVHAAGAYGGTRCKRSKSYNITTKEEDVTCPTCVKLRPDEAPSRT